MSNFDRTPSFKVCTYAPGEFDKVFSNGHATVNPSHRIFFKEYFDKRKGGFDIKTLVIEYGYTSQSFLDDYAGYYANCFREIPKKCNRVHLFEASFNSEQFISLISKSEQSDESIWKSYIGYIVIRPLQSSIVGATLLKCYPKIKAINNDRRVGQYRHFTATRKYEVHVFGKKLKLKTLAFQQQEKNVMACATIALWSAFQKTSRLFQTRLPSPHSITLKAGNIFLTDGRNTPNAGLDSYQIGKAISSTGLVYELRTRRNRGFLDYEVNKALIYSYLRAGIPVIMGISFPNPTYFINGFPERLQPTECPHCKYELTNREKIYLRCPNRMCRKAIIVKDELLTHLITVTGYREDVPNDDSGYPKFSEDFKYRASRISRFYVHDDQIGPFARVDFNNEEFFSAWWKNNKVHLKIEANIDTLFIPLDPIIRISFEMVSEEMLFFDKFLYQFFYPKNEEAAKDIRDFEWDIYLSRSEDYKKSIRKSVGLYFNSLKSYLLTTQLPKYVWVARAYNKEDKIIEVIIDATGLVNDNNILHINFFTQNLYVELLENNMLDDKDFIKNFENFPGYNKYFDILGRQVRIFKEMTTA